MGLAGEILFVGLGHPEHKSIFEVESEDGKAVVVKVDDYFCLRSEGGEPDGHEVGNRGRVLPRGKVTWTRTN